MDIENYLANQSKLVDQVLDQYLPKEEEYPPVIHQSMRYSVFAGGKRLRPILALAACEAVGGSQEKVLPAACALEMIHTHSLIHDDLPAMDNDDYRRGKLTNHKVFGEGIAVLAGCGLLIFSFELLAKNIAGFPAPTLLQVIAEIAQATGVKGMIGGQVVDLESEGKKISLDTLKYIHTHKTGALLRCSVRIGAMLGQASPEQLDKLTVYAEKIGLAFQIIDDILDLVGDEKKLGKKVGSDLVNEKATYPAFYGLEESKKTADRLVKEAKEEIASFGEKGQALTLLADYLVKREF